MENDTVDPRSLSPAEFEAGWSALGTDVATRDGHPVDRSTRWAENEQRRLEAERANADAATRLGDELEGLDEETRRKLLERFNAVRNT